MATTLIILVIAAICAGALTRSTFGFGESLVSMPLLALISLDLPTAISLVGLAGLIVATLTVITSWRNIDRPSLTRIITGAIIGIPFGVLLVKHLPASVVTMGLGLFMIAYGAIALYRLYFRKQPSQTTTISASWGLPTGFISGTLGSAYNSHGIPVVIYGNLRGWTPSQFRSTLQANYLISGILIVIGQALGGLWTPHLPKLFLLSLPFIILSTLLGMYLHHRIPTDRFQHYIYRLLIILGVLLLIKIA